MLFDSIVLLYEFSLILAHDLMLVLMILYEKRSLFIIQISEKLAAFVKFLFFLARMVPHYVNHVNF